MGAGASTVPISGATDARFDGVRDAFAANFERHGERGGAVCVVLDGTVVVDLWGGFRDEAGREPWDRDTLVNVFSVGKALVATAVARLVGEGRLALDEPLAGWWPRFDRRGKGGITLRQVLSHTAGLPAVRTPLPDDAVFSASTMRTALAGEAPFWEPGTTHGYHVNTFGFLTGAAIEHASGRTVGRYLSDEVAGRLDCDLHVGLSLGDLHRVAEFHWPAIALPDQPASSEPRDEASNPLDEMRRLAYFNPSTLSGYGVVNTDRWRRCEHPSANAHGTARGVARLFDALAHGGALDGVRVVERTVLEEFTTEAASGHDLVLERPSRFGLGFQLTMPERPLGPGAGGFGHFGAGGSLGFCDPGRRLAFGYVTNDMGPRWQNPRNRGLVDAVTAALD